MSFSRLVRAAWLIAALIPSSALAQAGNSTISGVVKDATGGALPGASVKVVNEDTGVSVDTVTNDEGLYRVPTLVPGRYRIETNLDGFDPAVRRPVTLEVGQTLANRHHARRGGAVRDGQRLGGGAAARGVADARQSRRSSRARCSTRCRCRIAPPRHWPSLAPGVIMIDTGVGTAENYPIFSVAGGRARNQNFILDGGNAIERGRPDAPAAVDQPAGRRHAGVQGHHQQLRRGVSATRRAVWSTMSTRSGTSQFRGSAFESLQNDALNARNFFATAKPRVRLNQFGGTFGGPITRGTTFFFGTWERTRQLTSETVVSTVPTLLNRAGDFSDLRTAPARPIVIYDPANAPAVCRQCDSREPARPGGGRGAAVLPAAESRRARRPTPTTTSGTANRRSTATFSSAASITGSDRTTC